MPEPPQEELPKRQRSTSLGGVAQRSFSKRRSSGGTSASKADDSFDRMPKFHDRASSQPSAMDLFDF